MLKSRDQTLRTLAWTLLLVPLICPTTIFFSSSTSAALVDAAPPPPGGSGIFDSYRRWTIQQRLRDPGVGQSFQNYSDSIHSLGRYIAVGSTSGNAFKGIVRIYYDSGRGHQLSTVLVDNQGILGDEFGYSVHLFLRQGTPHVAVGAPSKNQYGAVFVFRQTCARFCGAAIDDQSWTLQQTLVKRELDYADHFGRWTLFDGDSLLVSAVAAYKASPRFVISATNLVGTARFIESTGSDPMPYSDPIYAYRVEDGRRNSTSLTLFQVINTDAPYTLDFGASVAFARDTLLVGASFRQQARFGYGSDGALVVKANELKILDGAAQYNFKSIDVYPNGTLTVDGFDELRGAGGFLNLRVLDYVKIHPGGVINVTGLGRKGAPTQFSYTPTKSGKGTGAGFTATSTFVNDFSCSYDGADASQSNVLNSNIAKTKRNVTSTIAFAEANGGGASFGTMGTAGSPVQCGTSGLAGNTYGERDLSIRMDLGSGGGAGFPWKIGSGGAGGHGGGMVQIVTKRFINYGTVEANGYAGVDGSFFSGGGGGGSGGAISISGTYFENYGYITARGALGGIRATGSGSGGSVSVRGGKGGEGRIYLEFITTVTNGMTIPKPFNTTKWAGSVYMYKKSKVDGRWIYKAILPRLSGMMFIGHSVALNSNLVAAIGSDQLTDKEPTQRVYLMDISTVVNSTSPVYRKRTIAPPGGAQDLGFGTGLFLSNSSLLVQAAGRGVTRGVVHLFSGGDLLKRTDKLESFTAKNSQPGDFYGQVAHYSYPQLLIQVPLSQDDGYPVSNRLSIGCIQLQTHVRNVTTSRSSIDCDYSVATANTTVNCRVRTRDWQGIAAGEISDLSLFTYPPNLRFVSRGLYNFTVYLSNTGPREVYAIYRGRKLPTFTITVTPAINPSLSNMTCFPVSVRAGTPVTCTIHAFPRGNTGEPNAASYFSAVVYNTYDQSLLVQQPDVLTTQHGTFRGPPSLFIPVDPLLYDFPTVSPAVSWQRKGEYSFTFTPWREGAFAAFAMYMYKPLRFPNPVLIDVVAAPVHPQRSTINCPAIAAPNRTIVCTLVLKDLGGRPAGNSALARNFSDVRYLNASMNAGTVILPVTTVWVDEGRISLLFKSAITGTAFVTAKYKNQVITMNPATGVQVLASYATNCQLMSVVYNSFTIVNQHAMSWADPAVNGVQSTKAGLQQGLGMCEAASV